MKRCVAILTFMLVLGCSPGYASAASFVSGGTGADGAFAPQATTEVQLPESGIFNFTTVNIPTGVTVKFRKNSTNTPVTILATGDVIINGTIDVSGTSGTSVVDSVSADDTLPGVGGPGGYSGGFGASKAAPGSSGGGGLGPGAGKPGPGYFTGTTVAMGGGGGGFGTDGTDAPGTTGMKGVAYGTPSLLPLIGGSGGGGASSGTLNGSGGGGGGGSILIASSGVIQLNGAVRANGGIAGNSYNGTCGPGGGGGGSGGAMRLIANTIIGSGALSAAGGAGQNVLYITSAGSCTFGTSARGGDGRIRVEAYTITLTGTASPTVVATFVPGQVTIPSLPTLSIASVGGVTAPALPTGTSDVTLPFNITNPVEVVLSATGIPVGTVVQVTVTPYTGTVSIATSSPLVGTTSSSSATAAISLGGGHSVV
ncbi:MAG: hypothetical protein ABIO65_06680, partial [Nitrospiria bacterium]